MQKWNEVEKLKNILESSNQNNKKIIKNLDELLEAVRIDRNQARLKIKANNYLLHRIHEGKVDKNIIGEYQWRVRESEKS